MLGVKTYNVGIHHPSDKELEQGMITKNATRCSICGSNADKYVNRYQCQVNWNHLGDLTSGVFTDLSQRA